MVTEIIHFFQMSDPRIQTIIDLVPYQTTVLNLGCAQNPYVHLQLAQKSKKIVGVDVNKKGLKQIKDKGLEVYATNVEEIKLKERFDYIVAGELIEHLNNPGLFIQSIKSHMKKNSTVIMTTPNISSIFLYIIIVLFDQTQDPTHVYYFDKKNLEVLLNRYDLKIIETKYVPPEIKFHGKGALFKLIFFLSTVLANIGYLFNKRFFGSYLLLVIKSRK